MGEIAQAGVFRGRIIKYGITESSKSRAVAVSITVAVDEAVGDQGEWYDWREHQIFANGDVWIIKADGTINERAVKSLQEHAGWDGDFMSVVGRTWKPTPVGITVEQDQGGKQGSPRWRIAWINDFENPSVGPRTADASRAKELQAQYGSQMRALAGNAARKPAPAGSGPAKPAPAPAKGGDNEYSSSAPNPSPATESTGSDIPF